MDSDSYNIPPGNNQRDDEHTMLGPDGRWYSPDKLDSYFVRRPAWITQSMSEILHEIYEDAYKRGAAKEKRSFIGWLLGDK